MLAQFGVCIYKGMQQLLHLQNGLGTVYQLALVQAAASWLYALGLCTIIVSWFPAYASEFMATQVYDMLIM